MGAEGMLGAQSAANQSRFKADSMKNGFSSFLSSALKGVANVGLNYATGGLSSLGGGGGGLLGGLGNWSKPVSNVPSYTGQGSTWQSPNYSIWQ
jgi:hypothetical protein